MTLPPGSIFICYRRDDSADVAGRIYDRLIAEFGRDAVYRDVDTIPFGEDFRVHVHTCLEKCQVGLVVIGPEWCTIAGRSGKPRLHEPADHVRLEVEAMLARGTVKTIPLYVRGAESPQPETLPETLQPIAFRNGADIRRDPDFHHDVERVLQQLRRLFEGTSAAPKSDPEKTVDCLEPAPAQDLTSPTPPAASPEKPPQNKRDSRVRWIFPGRLGWTPLAFFFGLVATVISTMIGRNIAGFAGMLFVLITILCIVHGWKSGDRGLRNLAIFTLTITIVGWMMMGTSYRARDMVTLIGMLYTAGVVVYWCRFRGA